MFSELLHSLAFNDDFNIFLQNGYMSSHGIPHNVIVNAKIMVDYLIPNVIHFTPRNQWIFGLEIRMNFATRLTDYFKAPANGSYQSFIPQKLLKTNSR